MVNNRIKQLEPQCWEHNEFGLNFNYEKFAKLIVAECAQAVFDTELDDCCSDSDVICAVSFHLKKHFGVEQ